MQADHEIGKATNPPAGTAAVEGKLKCSPFNDVEAVSWLPVFDFRIGPKYEKSLYYNAFGCRSCGADGEITATQYKY